MSSQDFHRIDEVYHNIYRNKFHREEPLIQENDYMSEDEEYHAKAKGHAEEAAKAIMHKLKLEYGDKFNPEKAKQAVQHALGSTTEEDCEEWMLKQDYSHTPQQKKGLIDYLKHNREEANEETDHKAYDDAKAVIKRVGSKVAQCITDRKSDNTFEKEIVTVEATPEKAQFTIYDNETEKTYKVTVELAK
jgi:hypothetical protein